MEVTELDKVLEFDIKNVWIHGESRNAYLLAMIDCYSREVVGHYFWYHCLGTHVKENMMTALDRNGLKNISAKGMRSNNGTQFTCDIVEIFLSTMNVLYERVHTALGQNYFRYTPCNP